MKTSTQSIWTALFKG